MITTGVYLVFNAAAFYIVAYYLFPKYLYKNQYIKFLLWFIFVLITSSMALTGGLYVIFKDLPALVANYSVLFMMAFSSVITVTGVLCGTKLIIEKIRSQRITRHLDQQRLESELQFLKAQVNPHFLFNAINSVYFLIKKDPEKAAETLIKLSDLLRFQLYDCLDDKLPIEKEIEYLTNFIALEKIRKGEKVKVDINFSSNLSGFHIAPFILMPFLENAFKYVSNRSDQVNLISVTLRQKEKMFYASFSNTKELVAKNEVGGIGLKNVKRRLELIYPDKHELQITNENKQYSVTLTIQLT
jgi:two-component system LytT family sensor kinase